MMLGALKRLFDRQEAPADLPYEPDATEQRERPTGVPHELTVAIEAATVITRGEPDPETGDIRLLVKVHTLGSWYWQGVDDAAERVGRHWSELSPHQCKRAAHLLATIISAVNRRSFNHASRRSWVWDW